MAHTYIIKTKADITQAMVDLCEEDSLTSLRDSVDGTLSVLKWDVSPDPAMFSGDTKYTHAEIRTTMSGTDWTPAEL